VFIALFNSDQKIIMNFVYPALLLPAMYIVGTAHRLTSERADRRELTDLFGRYASTEVMHQLTNAADRGELNLGGTLRKSRSCSQTCAASQACPSVARAGRGRDVPQPGVRHHDPQH
jgi:hypothetical protein